MIFIGIVGMLFLVDYLAKRKAQESLKEGVVREVLGDKILLRKLHNEGIAFGLFAKSGGIKIVGIALLLAGMLVEFLRLIFQKGCFLEKLGYACLLGGGLNNFYDRCKQGYVTDYFSFNVKWDRLRQLVFNLSDLFIAIGMILVCVSKIWGNKKR